MRIFNYCFAIIATMLITGFLPSCSTPNNSQPINDVSAYPRVIERAKKDNRSFIMHTGADTFAVTSLQVERTKKEFTIHLNKLDSLHRYQVMHPKSSPQKLIYLFLQDSAGYTLDEPHTIPFTKLTRIELIN